MELYQYIVSEFFGILIFLGFLDLLQKRIILIRTNNESEHDRLLTFICLIIAGLSISVPIPLCILLNIFCFG